MIFISIVSLMPQLQLEGAKAFTEYDTTNETKTFEKDDAVSILIDLYFSEGDLVPLLNIRQNSL